MSLISDNALATAPVERAAEAALAQAQRKLVSDSVAPAPAGVLLADRLGVSIASVAADRASVATDRQVTDRQVTDRRDAGRRDAGLDIQA